MERMRLDMERDINLMEKRKERQEQKKKKKQKQTKHNSTTATTTSTSKYFLQKENVPMYNKNNSKSKSVVFPKRKKVHSQKGRNVLRNPLLHVVDDYDHHVKNNNNSNVTGKKTTTRRRRRRTKKQNMMSQSRSFDRLNINMVQHAHAKQQQQQQQQRRRRGGERERDTYEPGSASVIEETLREAEKWRETIAEQEMMEDNSDDDSLLGEEEMDIRRGEQGNPNSPLSEDGHLGTSLLGYELNRLRTRVAPAVDFVLGYSEEPQ